MNNTNLIRRRKLHTLKRKMDFTSRPKAVIMSDSKLPKSTDKAVLTKDGDGFYVIPNNMDFKRNDGTNREISIVEKFAALETSIQEASKILKTKS